jgi:hypothetical protein
MPDGYITYQNELTKIDELEKENEKLYAALTAIFIQTASAGGSPKDMIDSLLYIDSVCRDILDEQIIQNKVFNGVK